MDSKKINQKEYLKKYLSGDVGKKKKKKKEKTATNSTIKIVDDDIDLSQFAQAAESELDYALGEDLPQIAGIIDERPADLIAKEDYKTSKKWKTLESNELVNESKVHDISSENKYSDERKSIQNFNLKRSNTSTDTSTRQPNRKQSPDASPPRKSRHRNASPDISPPRRSKRSPDASPPRKSKRRNDSPDVSLPRRSRRSPDASPPRRSKYRKESPDASPPRRSRRSNDASPPRRSKYKNNSPDISPPRRSKRSPDASPPRRSKYKNESPDISPPRRSKRSPDASPPRKSKRRNESPAASPPRRSRRSSDASPPRRSKHRNESPAASPPRRSKRSPDTSPPRRLKYKNKSPDLSPPRQRKFDVSDSPPPTHKKITKTLDGKKAGLQNANDLREENEQHRKREDEMFKKIQSGDQQKNIVNDRKTGRHRYSRNDERKDQEKLKKEEERKQVYDRWGKGLKQIDDYKKQVATDSHEMEKPVARYADDKDLEDYQRNQCRDGDPMAAYFQKKAKSSQSGPSKPIYQGAFPENRFNIRPGYRWDGVDRSNGYEKKWFDVINSKKSLEEEAYKYSVEDM